MEKNKFLLLAEKHLEKMKEIRRKIHKQPETSFQEFKTAELIKKELTKLNIPYIDKLAKTGVVGLIKGKYPGKTVLLRADMDALPMTEESEVEYKSQVPGCMHACGHDGHVAGVLGTAMILNELKDELHGNVKVLFQLII